MDETASKRAKSLQTLASRARRAGKMAVAQQLLKQLRAINYTGVHPEVKGVMIGYCAKWQQALLSQAGQVHCTSCGEVILQWDAPHTEEN